MPQVHRFVPVVVLSLLITAPARAAQDAPDRSLDENPYQDEKPLFVPQRQIPFPPMPPRLPQISLIIDGRPVILEWPGEIAPVDDADDLAPPLARPPARIDGVRDLKAASLAAENFDNWVFGAGRTESDGRLNLDRMLREMVEDAARKYGLDDARREKLGLAGLGDAERLLARARAVRLEFEEARRSYLTGRAALRRVGALSGEFQRGPFGHGSLFAKVLAKILADREAEGGPKP